MLIRLGLRSVVQKVVWAGDTNLGAINIDKIFIIMILDKITKKLIIYIHSINILIIYPEGCNSFFGC